MKKFSLIFRCVASLLVAIVALVFTILEATLLVTLDFTLYENQLIAFVQLVLRLLIASSALTLGVFSLVKRERSFLLHGICLLSSTVVMIFFVSNNVGIYLAAVSALFVISQLLPLEAQK